MTTARFVQAEPIKLNVELVLTREEASDLYRVLERTSDVGSYLTYIALKDLFDQSKKETTTR